MPITVSANKVSLSSLSQVQNVISGLSLADTLVLSEDVTVSTGLNIDCATSVLVVDLNGFSFSVVGDVTVADGKQLVVVDGDGSGSFSASSFAGPGSMKICGGVFPNFVCTAAVQYEGYISLGTSSRYGTLPYLFSNAQSGDSIFVVDNVLLYTPIQIAGSRSLTLCSTTSDTIFRMFSGFSLFTIESGSSLTLYNIVVDGSADSGMTCSSHGGLFLVLDSASLALQSGASLINSALDDGSFGSAVFCLGSLSLSGNAMAFMSQGSNLTLAGNGFLSVVSDYTGRAGLSQYDGTSLMFPRIDSLVGICNHTVMGADSIFSDLDSRYTIKFNDNDTMCWGYAPGIAIARFVSFNHVDTLLFTIGKSADAPAIVNRNGYKALSWQPLPPIAPNVYTIADTIFVAQYERKTYKVEWENVQNRTYGDGDPIQGVFAYFYDDDSVPRTLSTMVFENSAPLVPLEVYNGVGTYTAWAVIPSDIDSVYQIDQSTISVSFSIYPKQLNISNIVVDTVKMYDATDTAHVVSVGLLNGLFFNDDVVAVPSASYNDAQPGFDKTVTAHFELIGENAANYKAPVDSVITCKGRILTEIELDDQGQGLIVNPDGYCASDSVAYTLVSGEPVEYSLVYDQEAQAQGFDNIVWADVKEFHSGLIPLIIPAGCHFGTYTATLTFRNELGLESTPFEFSFNVNIPVEYLKATFVDVISFDLSNDSLDSYQWYYKGGIVIDGATNSYFHSPRNLKGYEIYLGGVYKGNEIRSCLISNFDILPDSHVPLSVYPNPVASVATVAIDSSNADELHTLKVVNAMGMVALQCSFVGSTCSVDVRSLPKGNYYVVVDNASQHIIVK